MNVARWMWNNTKGILVKLGIWVCIGGVLRTEVVLRVVFPWAPPWMRKSMPLLYLCDLCKIALKKKISQKFLVWEYTYSLRYTIFPFIRKTSTAQFWWEKNVCHVTKRTTELLGTSLCWWWKNCIKNFCAVAPCVFRTWLVMIRRTVPRETVTLFH